MIDFKFKLLRLDLLNLSNLSIVEDIRRWEVNQVIGSGHHYGYNGTESRQAAAEALRTRNYAPHHHHDGAAAQSH
jgi:hypothetical protein